MMIVVAKKKKSNQNFLHILFLFCVEIIKPATLQTPAVPAPHPHITCVSGLKPSTHHFAVTDPNVVVKTVIWMNLRAELTGCVTCEGRV